jgi:hypothetical protein
MKKIVAILTVASALVAGCDEVSMSYPTRADAARDSPFARGWLPEIIPASSKRIVMTNDLDLNISNGSFQFDASDHDAFVARLARTPADDRDGNSAYSYRDWIFWISPDHRSCRFYMRLGRQNTLSEGSSGSY